MTRNRARSLVASTMVGGLAAAALAVAGPTAPAHAAPVEIQILATNDFHGRLTNNTSNAEAGAAVLAGAVKQLRGENPNTVFAAAGDLIGASTFESFIQKDKPTIDALNEAGLEVSAVGNHELDQGYQDLVDRVMAPYDADTNPLGGAAWEYIAANIEEPDGADEIAETWTVEFGDVEVGFVGAVTEDLPSLVSPAGIAGLTVTDIVDATNEAAAQLTADGADVVVMLVHEGSSSTNCASPSFTDPTTVWGNIVNNVSAEVDAIVSGHTHLAYNCTIADRPVVSAGQYGTNLNQLLFTVEGTTGEVTEVEQNILALETANVANYPADAATTAIVEAAVDDADELGAVELGEIAAPINRAQVTAVNDQGQTVRIENRGGESTAGNLVAEVQRWATEAPESGAAEIAFMNPGGIRADMTGPAVTYKQAATVQSFANTLVNMDLTGAQIETVLEQQWQRTAADAVPTRSFLRLGVSEGFSYTYTERPDPAHEGFTLGEVTGMWLDGQPIDPAATYSVTANSFLASGGDNFHEFANGTGKADTGKVDLAAMVDYMAEFASETPLAVPYEQRAVEVTFPDGAPETYPSGGTVEFDLASLSMSTEADAVDEEVAVSVDGTELGTFPVETVVTDVLFQDDTGTASVSVDLPADLAGGDHDLLVTGATTGTEVVVPISVEAPAPPEKVTPTLVVKRPDTVKVGTRRTVTVKVVAAGITATGKVTFKIAGTTKSVTLRDGKASFLLPAFKKPGKRELSIAYSGNDELKRVKKVVTIRVVRRR